MAVLPSTLRKELFIAALRVRSEVKRHLNLLFLWLYLFFSREADLSFCMQLLEQTATRTGRQGSEPILLSILPICSSLAVSVLYSGAVTTEQGTTETQSVLAPSPRSLNKPETMMFTTVLPAYRLVNLVAFLSSAFYPCWFLAVGSVCCEDQPPGPCRHFSSRDHFREQQLECKKVVWTPKRCWDPGFWYMFLSRES